MLLFNSKYFVLLASEWSNTHKYAMSKTWFQCHVTNIHLDIPLWNSIHLKNRFTKLKVKKNTKKM
jgi:hypothetical protein